MPNTRITESPITLESVIDSIKLPQDLTNVISPKYFELESRVYKVLSGIGKVAAELLPSMEKYQTLLSHIKLFNVEVPGYIVVLHYDPNNPNHTCHVEALNGPDNLVYRNILTDNNLLADFVQEGLEDGATLIGSDGKILGVKQRLIDLDTHYIDKRQGETIVDKRGFDHGAGTRHFSAQDMSKTALGTVVYVSSAERPGEIHRLVDGMITYSSIPKPPKQNTIEI